MIGPTWRFTAGGQAGHTDGALKLETLLMDCLTRLGYDIEINVRPPTESVGRLTLAVA